MSDFVLPGFLSPDADNANGRLLAQPNGDVRANVARGEMAARLPLPDLEVIIGLEMGPRMSPVIIDHSQLTLLTFTDSQGPAVDLCFNARELGLAPGNYTLRVQRPAGTLMERSLVVSATPDNSQDWTTQTSTQTPPTQLAPVDPTPAA